MKKLFTTILEKLLLKKDSRLNQVKKDLLKKANDNAASDESSDDDVISLQRNLSFFKPLKRTFQKDVEPGEEQFKQAETLYSEYALKLLRESQYLEKEVKQQLKRLKNYPNTPSYDYHDAKADYDDIKKSVKNLDLKLWALNNVEKEIVATGVDYAVKMAAVREGIISCKENCQEIQKEAFAPHFSFSAEKSSGNILQENENEKEFDDYEDDYER